MIPEKLFKNLFKLFLITGLLYQVGCEKSGFEPAGKNKRDHSVNKPYLKTARYDNPQEYLGVEYTNTMDHLSEDGDFPDMDDSLVYESNHSHMDNALNGTDLYGYQETSNEFQQFIGDEVTSKAEFAGLSANYFFEHFRESVQASDELTYYIDQLEEAYHNFSDTDTFLDTLAHYEAAISNEGFSDDQDTLLLSIYAIAGETLVYWENARQSDGHGWHSELHENLTAAQAKDLVLNLSIAGALGFGLTYDDLRNEEKAVQDAVFTGLIRSVYVPGPTVIDPGVV